MYAERNSRLGFLLRWLCSQFFCFACALRTHNGHLLQKKNWRSLLEKFPILECAFLYIFTCCMTLTAEEIDGFWKNCNQKTGKPGIIVSIYEYKGKHYGRIVGSYDSNGVLEDTIYHAVNRARGVKGNHFYSGIDFIWNLTKKSSGSRFKGKIMDPRKGKTYDVELWLQDGNLIVRGELLFFGRNEVWTAATENDFSVSFQKPDVKKFIPVIPEAN
jgi:uncharacterized protein (DUF2147 family)